MTTEQRKGESDKRVKAPEGRSAAAQEWIESCLLNESPVKQGGLFSRWRQRPSGIGMSQALANRFSARRLGNTAFVILGSFAGGLTFVVALELGAPFRDAGLAAACVALLSPALAIAAMRTVHLLFRILVVVAAVALAAGVIWLVARLLFDL
jgi:hypothetical protein